MARAPPRLRRGPDQGRRHARERRVEESLQGPGGCRPAGAGCDCGMDPLEPDAARVVVGQRPRGPDPRGPGQARRFVLAEARDTPWRTAGFGYGAEQGAGQGSVKG